MVELALKLIIAHVLGDFVLQPDKWVEDKKQKKHKSPALYYHLLIHAFAVITLLGFNLSYWPIIITIVVSHYIIDLIKLNIPQRINGRLQFISDQLAHLLVIGILVYIYVPYQVNWGIIYSEKALLFVLAILCVTYVAAIFMKMIMSKWPLPEDCSNDSLEHAGKYIGILERLFVFGFIVLNQWAAIGLLITAKSVFRFGDLTRSKDRKLTEYILIGTLLSFGMAIIVGVIYLKAIKEWI
jgi:hypothetical protein